MTTNNINLKWAQELLTTGKDMANFSGELPEIDWVQNGKSFKKQLTFKLLPGNSKENGVFSYIVGTHWIEAEGRVRRFVCPEQTMHLKKSGTKCPICEAKRRLLANGFSEEQLSKQGKYGPIPLFDPKMTSNVKVVVLSSDIKSNWDKAHISVLQQNGTFLTRWLVEKCMDHDTPDLLAWERSNAIKFSRASDNSRFERELSFTTFEPSTEVITKLREENESLTLGDLWRMPSDQEILEMTRLMEALEQGYISAKDTVNAAVANTMKSSEVQDVLSQPSAPQMAPTVQTVLDDNIPF